MTRFTSGHLQNGLAMITVMLILIALTLIVLSGSRNSTMQLRMASNLQSRLEAVEYAQSALDWAEAIPPSSIQISDNYKCYGDMNSFYAPSISDYTASCIGTEALDAPIDTKTGLILVRDPGLEGDLPPSMATSTGLIETAFFRAYGGYDNTNEGQGRAILGTGVNPGFLMDAWPMAMSSVCQEVKRVRVVRVQDASPRRLPFQKKIGAGCTVEEFEELAAAGTLRHVGLTESIDMIAAGLNWQLSQVIESIEPVIAREQVNTKYLTIRKGQVAGVRQVGRGLKDREELITLEFEAFVISPCVL